MELEAALVRSAVQGQVECERRAGHAALMAAEQQARSAHIEQVSHPHAVSPRPALVVYPAYERSPVLRNEAAVAHAADSRENENGIPLAGAGILPTCASATPCHLSAPASATPTPRSQDDSDDDEAGSHGGGGGGFAGFASTTSSLASNEVRVVCSQQCFGVHLSNCHCAVLHRALGRSAQVAVARLQSTSRTPRGWSDRLVMLLSNVRHHPRPCSEGTRQTSLSPS